MMTLRIVSNGKTAVPDLSRTAAATTSIFLPRFAWQEADQSSPDNFAYAKERPRLRPLLRFHTEKAADAQVSLRYFQVSAPLDSGRFASLVVGVRRRYAPWPPRKQGKKIPPLSKLMGEFFTLFPGCRINYRLVQNLDNSAGTDSSAALAENSHYKIHIFLYLSNIDYKYSCILSPLHLVSPENVAIL